MLGCASPPCRDSTSRAHIRDRRVRRAEFFSAGSKLLAVEGGARQADGCGRAHGDERTDLQTFRNRSGVAHAVDRGRTSTRSRNSTRSRRSPKRHRLKVHMTVRASPTRSNARLPSLEISRGGGGSTCSASARTKTGCRSAKPYIFQAPSLPRTSPGAPSRRDSSPRRCGSSRRHGSACSRVTSGSRNAAPRQRDGEAARGRHRRRARRRQADVPVEAGTRCSPNSHRQPQFEAARERAGLHIHRRRRYRFHVRVEIRPDMVDRVRR